MQRPIRSRLLFTALAAVSALGLSACFGPAGPYPTGLIVETQSDDTSITRSYRVVAGGSPKESKGAVGIAASCDDARSSSGTLQSTSVGTTTQRFEVIGQTEGFHPLIPGAEVYGSNAVSIIERTAAFDGSAEDVETFRDPGGAVGSWEEVREADLNHASAATYSGIAADEYVVELTQLGDTWEALEFSDDMNVNLLTRNNAQDNDIWSSLDGNLLYIADGFEDLAVGGQTVSARKVRVLSVENVDPEGGSVFGDCLKEDNQRLSTTHPNTDDFTVTSAALDPGCADAFVHREVGAEWWYQNVMVKAEKTTYEVTINDFGYEWYETAGNTCSRFTSPTKDDADAALFVEYTVTERLSVMETVEWTQAAAE